MAQRNSPPGPPASTALSNIRRFARNRAEFLYDLWRHYGDVCRFRLGLYDIYFINRPELVREVFTNHAEFPKTPATQFLSIVIGNGLLLSKGEEHRRQRRLMQPAFHKKRVAAYAEVMSARAAQMSRDWDGREEIEIHDQMMRLTMEAAAQCLLGTSVSDVTSRVSQALTTMLPIVNRIAEPTGFIKMFLPTPLTLRFYRARRELNGIIYSIIDERRKNGEDTGDLLSMLLMAQDEDGSGGMTDQQVRDEAITIFLAGHETTAVALSWTFCLLAQHPEALERVRREIDAVLEGRVPTFDDVPKLAYIRAVISEAMRLYPPVYLIDRIPRKDWDIGDYVIPKNKYVFTSPYTLHRHPEFWPNPERFDPDRWTPEEVEKRPKFAYFPFGGGPRICIGEHFAWTEMILVVAIIFQKWNLSLIPNQDISIGPLITMRPQNGIRMRLEKRKQVEHEVDAVT